jgi:sarcosine oxidase/L-pipecolate oxidase
MSEYRSAYANPEAGWADAGIAVKRIIEESIRVGLQYRVGDAVDVVLGSQSRVRGVRFATGEIVEADKIVLATGAWTSFLMDGIEEKLLLSHEERIERQLTAAGVCVAHYQLTEEEAKVYSKMPVIVNGEKGALYIYLILCPSSDAYYSSGEVIPPSTRGTLKFTCTGSFTNTIKVASGQSISVPPSQDQSIVPQVLKNEILGIIKSLMPQFEKNGREVDWWRLCWDSITPTQNQLICQHPNPSLRNLYLAVGGSFHSYKFLPTIGKYVVNVIQGVSNGDEKDRAWEWKQTGPPEKPEMAHANVIPRRHFKDLVHTGSK